MIHYMKALRAADTTEGIAAVKKMKEIPIDDPLFGKGLIRPDGRAIHDMYLFRVKSPAESHGPYDYYSLVSTMPGAQAFRPLSEGGCPLVAH